MKAIRLRTEHMENPLGIDIREPFLSWNCEGGKKQTAYEIEAVSEGQVIWNSGKVASDRMNTILGTAALSRQRVEWRVRLWDETDTVGEWSEEAFFEMGILEREQFVAKWINPELTCNPQEHKPASYLRTTFSLERKGNARLYITCHGLYEAFLNGKRIGEFVLAPGTCTYDKQLAYQTYDVTDLVEEGDNQVQVILGDGWYRSCSGVDGDRNLYGEDVALFFQLEVDGKAVCISDESWEASQSGPVRENDMQQGEVVDGRIEEITDYHGVKVENFGVENLCCSNCVPIVEREHFEGRIIQTPNGETVIDYGQNLAGYVEFTVHAHEGQRIVLTHGESLDENGNFTAENFQDRGRHKEGGINQRVTYLCKEGENHYKSKFTIWGFRYAKVETDVDLSKAHFTSIAVYSKMEQLGSFTCSNADVNKLVENSIWSQKSNFCDVPTDCPTRERAAWTGDMGVFAETGLFLEDCYPVIRKWLGECRLNQHPDGKVANTAPRNNEPSFFSGLLAGSVGWGDASIIVPYALYERYGDKRILEENYEMMQKWYQYLESRAGQGGGPKIPGGMGKLPENMQKYLGNAQDLPESLQKNQGNNAQGLPENLQKYQNNGQGLPEELQKYQNNVQGLPENSQKNPGNAQGLPEDLQRYLQDPEKLQKYREMMGKTDANSSSDNPYSAYTIETGVDYGEWCEPDVESTSAMGKPQPKVATAYFAKSGYLLAEIAEILDRKEDAAKYRETAEQAKKAFRQIATENGRIRSDRQAEYVRAISFDLLSEDEKKQAAEDLNDLVIKKGYHLNTGFLSTPSLCPVLAEHGYLETAYKLLLQDSMPGWLYAVKKGATTIWENWDGINEKGEVKASLNHYSYGAVCGWLFGGICGIRLKDGKITISPQPHKSLQYAKAVYNSPAGEIVSGWKYEGDKVAYEIRIPSNAEAEVILPDGRREVLTAGSYCL